MIKIIGFTGKKGHGKSTASEKAKEILEKQGAIVKRINFKDALVSTMKEKLGGVLNDLSVHYNMSIDDLFYNKPPIMRHLMQQIGTEVYRSMNDNYWVDKWKEDVYNTENTVIIVDDVRFKNELDAVLTLGGVVYKVVATNKPIPEDQHQSEKEMDEFVCDSIIADNKEDLEAKVAFIFKPKQQYNITKLPEAHCDGCE